MARSLRVKADTASSRASFVKSPCARMLSSLVKGRVHVRLDVLHKMLLDVRFELRDIGLGCVPQSVAEMLVRVADVVRRKQVSAVVLVELGQLIAPFRFAPERRLRADELEHVANEHRVDLGDSVEGLKLMQHIELDDPCRSRVKRAHLACGLADSCNHLVLPVRTVLALIALHQASQAALTRHIRGFGIVVVVGAAHCLRLHDGGGQCVT